MIFIAIYVDDVLCFTNCMKMKHELYNILTTNFKMKDLGEAKFCLDLRITHDKVNNAIYLDQERYINDMLDRFGMTDCKPADTPADPNKKLTKCEDSENNFDRANTPYQQAVGSIFNLTQGTRPDVAFAVNSVSRFNTCFGREHWMAVKRIFRYLKGNAIFEACI